jgi:integrase/recombinase XerD
LPEIVTRAGKAAVFAAEEYFFGRIRNKHTRRPYWIAVKRFLTWAETRGLELVGITPKDVGQYLDGLRKETWPLPPASNTWPRSVISSTAW